MRNCDNRSGINVLVDHDLVDHDLVIMSKEEGCDETPNLIWWKRCFEPPDSLG